MRFPERDLTDQYISASYEDVLQQYIASPTSYVLDGFGNVVFSIPSSSVGGTLVLANPSGSAYVSNSLLFNINPVSVAREEGQVFWDSSNHTLALIPDFTASTLQIGQEQWMRVHAHENIYNGQVVYIHETIAGVPCVALAIADGTGTKSSVIGMATNDIPSGSIGLITTNGKVNDLNTSAFVSGDTLYLSSTISGSYQASGPLDPYETVIVGYVTNADAVNGNILVSVSDMGSTNYPFVGVTHAPTITSGSVTPTGSFVYVGTGSVNFCETSDGTGLVKNFTLNSASFAMTASFLDVQYIVARYNNGNPVFCMCSSRTGIDEIQVTLVSTVVPAAGGRPSFASWDSPGTLLANRDYARVTSLRKLERQNGLNLSIYDSANRYFAITAGRAWQGVTPQDLVAMTSSVDRVVLVAHSASVWSGSLITQLIYDQCDNGTNVVPLGAGANHWVTNYVYRTIGTLNATLVLLSQDYASVTDAIAGTAPTPPPEMPDTAFLVGRVIYKKSTIPAVQVDSAYVESYTPAGITIHNYLSGLQGGDGNLGEFYHLKAGEYAGINAYQTVSASYTVLATDGTIYASASSANIILTLPDVATVAGQFFRIKKIDSTGYEVIISSSVNIDYDTELRLSQRGSSVTLHSNATQYWIH